MDGFLPTRGSWTLDLVFVAMMVILLVLGYSIRQVRSGRYQLHKRIQITVATVLLITVAVFEIDMRFFTDWRELAAPSPLYDSGWVHFLLYIHLIFAIPTPVVWAVVIWLAWRRFDRPPRPGLHSRLHRRLGWLATLLMLFTSFTGWLFYVVAFVW